MRFFTLFPEVAGCLGNNTVMSRQQHPPTVSHLHYQLDGWLGDDLLESFPCFVATKRLVDGLRNKGLSGYELNNVEISTSEQFRDVYPDRELPEFAWLLITGIAGLDDFGVDSDGRLVVSENALSVLKGSQLINCEISDFN